MSRALFLSLMSSTMMVTPALSQEAPPVKRIETTGEGALAIAVKLIKEGHLDEAEQILRTLSSARADQFDMRPVDRLAAKIAYDRGNSEEAVRLLTALVEYDPEDWRTRYDLAQVLIVQEKDRKAEKHLRKILRSEAHDELKLRARQALAIIDNRREVRISFRASAAPSTNVNSATSAESIDLFGGAFRANLDDDARAQSGLGVSWALNGLYTPKLSDSTKGHVMALGQLTDYGNKEFDQGATGLELGFRFANPGPNTTGVLIAATGSRQFFANDPYATRGGVRVSLSRPLSKRSAIGAQLSAEQVTYDGRPDRDGPVYSLALRYIHLPVKWAQLSLTGAVTREDAEAETNANTQYAAGVGVELAGPARTVFSISPTFTWREFDDIAAIYGTLREDETISIATGVAKTDWTVRGFFPTLSYRYTDNDSTVELFEYDEHAVDVGFTRSF